MQLHCYLAELYIKILADEMEERRILIIEDEKKIEDTQAYSNPCGYGLYSQGKISTCQ
jgi:hypothetical protein